MEISSLELGLRYISDAGNTLNLYEITRLQVALLVLQKQENKDKIFFWGRIRAQHDDYYIAYTLEDSDYIYPNKKMFFRSAEDFNFSGFALIHTRPKIFLIQLFLFNSTHIIY